MKSAPKQKNTGNHRSPFEAFFPDDMEEVSADHIAVDAWGNEWDDSGDFIDMDFRLIEE